MATNRRQHWVPRAYLRGFADEAGRLRVFARMEDAPGIRDFMSTVDGIGHERDLYSGESETGRDNSLDDKIRTEIEDHIPETLAPILQKRRLSDEEWLKLVKLAGAQDLRSPAGVHNLTEAITKMMEYSGMLYEHHVPGITQEQVQERLREHLGPTERSAQYALNPKNIAVDTLKGTIGFTGQFAGMFGCIIETQGHDFFTSDYPVRFADPSSRPHPFYGIDRSGPHVEVTFPLTRRFLLLMARIPLAQYVLANHTGVTLLNARTAHGAHQHIYAYPVQGTAEERRQRRDLLRQLGALPLSGALLSRDGTGIAPVASLLPPIARARERILFTAFTERNVSG